MVGPANGSPRSVSCIYVVKPVKLIGHSVARISTAYNADASSSKLDLSLPGFRDDAGRPFVPPTVRHVEKQLRNTELLAREALPVWGDERFLAEGIEFAYGSDHGTLNLEHVSSVDGP